MMLRSPAPPYDPAQIQRNITARLADANRPTSDRLLAAVVHYSILAPPLGIRWDFTLAQAIHETDWSDSPVCRNQKNWAGIKDPETGQYRTYASDVEGIRDHCALLAVYTGLHVPDTPDPTRNHRTPPFAVAFYASDLNGVWAFPGDRYAENVERTRHRIFDQ